MVFLLNSRQPELPNWKSNHAAPTPKELINHQKYSYPTNTRQHFQGCGTSAAFSIRIIPLCDLSFSARGGALNGNTFWGQRLLRFLFKLYPVSSSGGGFCWVNRSLVIFHLLIDLVREEFWTSLALSASRWIPSNSWAYSDNLSQVGIAQRLEYVFCYFSGAQNLGPCYFSRFLFQKIQP